MNVNHYIISLNSVKISYCRAPEQVAMDRLVELAYRKQLVTPPPPFQIGNYLFTL